QRLDVAEVGHPTRGDHRGVGALAHLTQQVDVGAAEGPVLGDVGDDVAGAAVGLEPVQHLPEIAALTRPATGGQGGAAHVQADGDPVAVAGDGTSGPVRVLQRRGAEVDTGGAGVQGPLERGVVADATGELDVHVQLAHDPGELLVARPAAEGGTQDDKVGPIRPLVPPGRGRLRRVAVRGLGTGLTVEEPDGLAVDDVDGGKELQRGIHRCFRLVVSRGGQPREATQLRSNWAPASPDFSGWNWVAERAPFSTAATNGDP